MVLENTWKIQQIRVFQVASLFEMSKCMWRDGYLWIHMRCIVLKQWCRCSDGSDNSAVSFWSFIWLAMILTVWWFQTTPEWLANWILIQFQEWSSCLLPAFLFHVSEKRLLSSPFTVTLTCTMVHHEFRFLFMFNLKSVSVCLNLFNAEYMNKFHFALCQPQSCEHMNVHYITRVVYIFISYQNHSQKANYI